MSGFTPGPWRGGGRIIETKGTATERRDIAEMVCEMPLAERTANSRLIAKAPEMYDLLQEWLGAVTIETDQGLIAKTEALLSEIEP
jgi:hypothetical protein